MALWAAKYAGEVYPSVIHRSCSTYDRHKLPFAEYFRTDDLKLCIEKASSRSTKFARLKAVSASCLYAVKTKRRCNAVDAAAEVENGKHEEHEQNQQHHPLSRKIGQFLAHPAIGIL